MTEHYKPTFVFLDLDQPEYQVWAADATSFWTWWRGRPVPVRSWTAVAKTAWTVCRGGNTHAAVSAASPGRPTAGSCWPATLGRQADVAVRVRRPAAVTTAGFCPIRVSPTGRGADSPYWRSVEAVAAAAASTAVTARGGQRTRSSTTAAGRSLSWPRCATRERRTVSTIQRRPRVPVPPTTGQPCRVCTSGTANSCHRWGRYTRRTTGRWCAGCSQPVPGTIRTRAGTGPSTCGTPGAPRNSRPTAPPPSTTPSANGHPRAVLVPAGSVPRILHQACSTKTSGRLACWTTGVEAGSGHCHRTNTRRRRPTRRHCSTPTDGGWTSARRMSDCRRRRRCHRCCSAAPTVVAAARPPATSRHWASTTSTSSTRCSRWRQHPPSCSSRQRSSGLPSHARRPRPGPGRPRSSRRLSTTASRRGSEPWRRSSTRTSAVRLRWPELWGISTTPLDTSKARVDDGREPPTLLPPPAPPTPHHRPPTRRNDVSRAKKLKTKKAQRQKTLKIYFARDHKRMILITFMIYYYD